MGRFVCESPRNPNFKIPTSTNFLWDNFDSILLVENHRQGADHSYAELLNRARIGKLEDFDHAALEARVRKNDHQDVKSASLFIIPMLESCAAINNAYIEDLPGDMITAEAMHYQEINNKYKPKIRPKDGTVSTTGFVNELKIKIGAQVMLIYNVATLDGLSNGQLGTVMAVIRKDDGQLDKIIVKFNNTSVGKENRQKFKMILTKHKMEHPGYCVIERVMMQYSIRDSSGAAGSKATLFQFPLKLSKATTAHKVQGLTIPAPAKVVIDISKSFEPAQAYVMLSRVQSIDQIFILDTYKKEKIRANQVGMDELKRLSEISLNNNPKPWEQVSDTTIKIAVVNCRSIVSDRKFKCVQGDQKLQEAALIHLSEISLSKEIPNPDKEIPGYQAHFCLVGKGKGIATFTKNTFEHSDDVVEETLQITKFESKELDSISCYRSDQMDQKLTAQKIRKLLNLNKPTVVTGRSTIVLFKLSNFIYSRRLQYISRF